MITDHFYVAARTSGWGFVAIAIYDRRKCPKPCWRPDNIPGCSVSTFDGAESEVVVREHSELDKSTTWAVRIDRAMRNAQERANQLNGIDRLVSQSLKIYQEASEEATRCLIEAEAELAARSKAAMAKAQNPVYL